MRAADPAAPHVRRVTNYEHVPDAIRASERAPGVAGSARRPTSQPPTHFKKRGRYIVAVSHRSLAIVEAHALVAVVKSLCVWR